MITRTQQKIMAKELPGPMQPNADALSALYSAKIECFMPDDWAALAMLCIDNAGVSFLGQLNLADSIQEELN